MQELIERFNTWSQAQYYLEHNEIDVADYLDEHGMYQQQIKQAEAVLKGLGPVQHIERQFIPQFKFHYDDIIIIIGQDGLVANTLKYLNGQAVIGVNPDPVRWDGKLLAFTLDDLESITQETINQRSHSKKITFALAEMNDGQRLLAVNDLFIGPRSHTSAQYQMKWNDQQETQCSSGVIISTGLGSTGWLSSILKGAFGITSAEQTQLKNGFSWDAQKLMFAVREPFTSQTSFSSLIFGAITANKTMQLTSLMPENGVVFSDGIESDFIEFNSGCQLTIKLAKTEGCLIQA